MSVYLHVQMVKKDLPQIHLAENYGISVERQTGPLPCYKADSAICYPDTGVKDSSSPRILQLVMYMDPVCPLHLRMCSGKASTQL